MYLEKEAEIIADYIKETRYTQAVMVNGAWGVGKTYFVDNILLKELKEYTVVHYSLYGVQSSEQVKSDLKREMLLKLIENKEFKVKEKHIKISSKIVELAPNALSILWTKLGLESDDLDEIIDKIEYDKSKILIIFDDVERAGMEINEVLGLINSYVECQKIKVIIIANENEMGSSRISTDLPLKYMVASNKFISLKEKDIDSNDGKKDNKEKVYNHSELIERTKILFSNDIVYNTIKEKLIGLTVTIRLNYRQLYDQIIAEYAIRAQSFLSKNKDSLIEVLQYLDCQNLRTFIFAVISFDKIYEVIHPLKSKYNAKKYGSLFEDELLSIMRSVVFFSVKYKSGQSVIIDNSTYSTTCFLGALKGIKEYSFVNKYISLHELDVESIKKGVSTYIEEEYERGKKQEEKELLSLYKIDSFGWLEYNDDDVIRLSDQLYEELSKEKYDVSFFKNIIVFLIQLEINFSEKREQIGHSDAEYINLMVEYIQSHELKENQIEMFRSFSFDNKFVEEFDKKALPLITATKEKTSLKTKHNDIFDSKDWAEQFYTYCVNNHDSFMYTYSFLSSFDIELIKNHLLTASNKDIKRFLQAICSVYDFGNIHDFFSSDYTALEMIISLLDNIHNDKETNCTTRVIISAYKSKLEGILKLLK